MEANEMEPTDDGERDDALNKWVVKGQQNVTPDSKGTPEYFLAADLAYGCRIQ